MILNNNKKTKMSSILDFLENQIVPPVNPLAIYNVKDQPIRAATGRSPVIPESPLPVVTLKSDTPDIRTVSDSTEGVFNIGDVTIELNKLQPSGRNTYIVNELNTFLKAFGVPVSGMKKAQKVDRIREEIKKINPNIEF